MVTNETTARQAIAWLLEQRDPSFADWDELTDWLEADPEHARVYDELRLVEAGVAERLSNLGFTGGPPRERQRSRRPRLGRWQFSSMRKPTRRGLMAGGGAIAASIVAGVLMPQWAAAPALYTVTTPAGVQRTLTLEAGTTIALNGASTIVLKRGEPRFASLKEGEAFFRVQHDESRPFTVEIGNAKLVDLGTAFNVAKIAGETRVAVAEGLVEYEGGGQTIRLKPDDQLIDKPDLLIRSKAEQGSVGSWRARKLIYRSEPLSSVAKDIARMTGISVVVDPSVATRPVTAVLQVPQDREQIARQLETLLDIAVERSKDHWTLTQR